MASGTGTFSAESNRGVSVEIQVGLVLHDKDDCHVQEESVPCLLWCKGCQTVSDLVKYIVEKGTRPDQWPTTICHFGNEGNDGAVKVCYGNGFHTTFLAGQSDTQGTQQTLVTGISVDDSSEDQVAWDAGSSSAWDHVLNRHDGNATVPRVFIHMKRQTHDQKHQVFRMIPSTDERNVFANMVELQVDDQGGTIIYSSPASEQAESSTVSPTTAPTSPQEPSSVTSSRSVLQGWNPSLLSIPSGYEVGSSGKTNMIFDTLSEAIDGLRQCVQSLGLQVSDTSDTGICTLEATDGTKVNVSMWRLEKTKRSPEKVFIDISCIAAECSRAQRKEYQQKVLLALRENDASEEFDPDAIGNQVGALAPLIQGHQATVDVATVSEGIGELVGPESPSVGGDEAVQLVDIEENAVKGDGTKRDEPANGNAARSIQGSLRGVSDPPYPDIVSHKNEQEGSSQVSIPWVYSDEPASQVDVPSEACRDDSAHRNGTSESSGRTVVYPHVHEIPLSTCASTETPTPVASDGEEDEERSLAQQSDLDDETSQDGPVSRDTSANSNSEDENGVSTYFPGEVFVRPVGLPWRGASQANNEEYGGCQPQLVLASVVDGNHQDLVIQDGRVSFSVPSDVMEVSLFLKYRLVYSHGQNRQLSRDDTVNERSPESHGDDDDDDGHEIQGLGGLQDEGSSMIRHAGHPIGENLFETTATDEDALREPNQGYGDVGSDGEDESHDRLRLSEQTVQEISTLCLSFQWEKLEQLVRANLTAGAITFSCGEHERTTILLHVLVTVCGDTEPRLSLIKTIIEKVPESASIPSKNGMYPLHILLEKNHCIPEDIKEYLVIACTKQYPDAVSVQVLEKSRSPLHVVVMTKTSRTDEMVQAMLTASPRVVFLRDDMGLLPIHLAVLKACMISTFSLLYDAYPESLSETTAGGLNVYDIAVRYWPMQELTTFVKSLVDRPRVVPVSNIMSVEDSAPIGGSNGIDIEPAPTDSDSVFTCDICNDKITRFDKVLFCMNCEIMQKDVPYCVCCMNMVGGETRCLYCTAMAKPITTEVSVESPPHASVGNE